MISTQSSSNSPLLASSPDYLKLALELGIGGIYGVPAGDHLYCRCPLHNDRTASFSLNVINGLWFCHAEQRGGQFFQLVMEMLGLDVLAAERWIRDNSYVYTAQPLPAARTVRPSPSMYEDTLSHYSRAEMPKYWFDRGFSWELADRFDIRYDMAQGRLAIPIRFPIFGPVVGIVYRSVADPSWKYRNSPDFPKKTTLYGYDPHSQADAILLTEGPLDALSAIQAGQSALATFGAYVTKDQLQFLKLMPVQRFIIAFDNDDEGRKASENVRHYISNHGFRAWLFKYPAGRKDVGECSPDEIIAGVADALPNYKMTTPVTSKLGSA